jgi:hypothetical protein
MFVALALCALLSASIVGAGQVAPHWTVTELNFRTQATTLGNSLYADSSTAAGSSARLDTTTAFPLLEAWTPEQSATRAAVDSIDAIIFRFDPVGGATGFTVTADSAFITLQVSMNGDNWLSTTFTRLGHVANTVNPASSGEIILEGSGQNSFARQYKQAYTATGQHSFAFEATAPTDNQTWGWRMARWIVGSSSTGRYKASVQHLTTRDKFEP